MKDTTRHIRSPSITLAHSARRSSSHTLAERIDWSERRMSERKEWRDASGNEEREARTHSLSLRASFMSLCHSFPIHSFQSCLVTVRERDTGRALHTYARPHASHATLTHVVLTNEGNEWVDPCVSGERDGRVSHSHFVRFLSLPYPLHSCHGPVPSVPCDTMEWR